MPMAGFRAFCFNSNWFDYSGKKFPVSYLLRYVSIPTGSITVSVYCLSEVIIIKFQFQLVRLQCNVRTPQLLSYKRFNSNWFDYSPVAVEV